MNISLRNGTKFRALENECKIKAEIVQDYRESPTHVTIRNWTLKIGYYELTRKKMKSNDWIILLDHSIQFGKEKIFVVLGIQENYFLKLKRPLQYTDLETLIIKPAKTWNGELVSREIKNLQKDIGIIKYAVGDYGSDLKKGLRLAGITHIHDLSHLISLSIEKIYRKDERYEGLKKSMSLMRNKFIQTDIASIVPPKSRKKSEYQSFDKTIKWAQKSLHLVNNTLNNAKKRKELKKEFNPETLTRIKKELSWINSYKELITELSEINSAIKEIEKKIKHNGFSLASIKSAERSLLKLQSKNGKSLKISILAKLHEQFELLPDIDNILFSSDILESTFGKYKNRVSENPMASVTNLMLIIAAFTCSLTEEKVKECIESVKTSDIKKWSKDNVGTSLHKQRSILLSA